MKIVVCGTRQFNNYDLLKSKLDEFTKDFIDNDIEITIVHGAAPGADIMSEQYAKENGIKYKSIPADWNNLNHPDAYIKINKQTGKKYDAKAGFRRNAKLLDLANMIIAFWDGKSPGTKHMIDESNKRNIPCFVIKYA